MTRRVVVELTGPQATALAAAAIVGRLKPTAQRAIAKLNTAILESRGLAVGGFTEFVKRRRRLDRGSR